MSSESSPPSQARDVALSWAEEMRSVRMQVIEQIRAGSRDFSEIVQSKDPSIGRIKVVAVLENIPGLGKVKARRMMDDIGISGDCKVRALSDEHRRALLESVGR